jgi:Protein of unknown function (DUF3105)
VANPGDANRRQTKAERRESARLERERIQRQMAARNRNRRIGVVLLSLAVVTAIVVAFVVKPGGSDAGQLASPQSLLDDASAAAKTAGCDAVANTPNFQNARGKDPGIDHAHIGDTLAPTAPPLSDYPTVPPASGPHDPTPATPGVYDRPPDIYRSIHALEHAGAIVWYAPAAADTPEVKAIRAFYSQTANVGQSKIIVAPYDFPDQGQQGSLPAGVQMALVAWHRLQTCAQPSLAVAFDFTSQYANTYPDRQYIGVAREPTASM